MLLTLKRCVMKPSKDYTIGRLYIDGKYFCDTLEDRQRGLASDMPLKEILRIKVKHQTAIPTGRYRVRLDIQSPKYAAKANYWRYNKGYMPRLMDVPGYEGVLIHPGNTKGDTSGCILVGRNTEVGRVNESMVAWKQLYTILASAKDEIWIEIK